MQKETRLTIAICLSLTFMFAEVACGLLANSLAVLSDAAHLLTDVAGFAIALLATIMSKRPASKKYTFGLARAEVMGALASILTLWIMTLGLVIEAYSRVLSWFEGTMEPIDGKIMFTIAVIGIIVNLTLACVFIEDHGGAFHDHDHGHGGHDDHHGHGDHDDHGHEHDHDHHEHDHGHTGHDVEMANKHQHVESKCGDENPHGHGHSHQHDEEESEKSLLVTPTSTVGYGSVAPIVISHSERSDSPAAPTDINIHAAYLHVMTDLMQSVGVALAGGLIYLFPQYQILDPICTFIFCGLILWSTMSLLRRVTTILFEGVPAHVDWESVLAKLQAIPGVKDVHDLHIWSISSQTVSLTCHILCDDPQGTLIAAHQVCLEFDIHHATIQVQDANTDAILCHSNGCNMENSLHKYFSIIK